MVQQNLLQGSAVAGVKQRSQKRVVEGSVGRSEESEFRARLGQNLVQTSGNEGRSKNREVGISGDQSIDARVSGNEVPRVGQQNTINSVNDAVGSKNVGDDYTSVVEGNRVSTREASQRTINVDLDLAALGGCVRSSAVEETVSVDNSGNNLRIQNSINITRNPYLNPDLNFCTTYVVEQNGFEQLNVVRQSLQNCRRKSLECSVVRSKEGVLRTIKVAENLIQTSRAKKTDENREIRVLVEVVKDASLSRAQCKDGE